MNTKYYTKRIVDLGFSGIAQVSTRYYKRFFFRYNYRLLQKIAHLYSKKYVNNRYMLQVALTGLCDIGLDTFFSTYLANDVANPKIRKHLVDTIMYNYIELLGVKIPAVHTYHYDYYYQSDYFERYKNIFYQDIVFTNKHNKTDIKTLWDLSRLQHVSIVAYDCYSTQKKDVHAYRYVIDTLVNWNRENTFSHGVNWLCPMDVALRAINILMSFAYTYTTYPECYTEQEISQIITMLAEHELYLRYNFETSDRPNNHYISDLVGYAYLVYFFSYSSTTYMKYYHDIYDVLVTEYKNQLHPDGSCYEGSTAYHRLTTELCLYAYLIAPANHRVYFQKTLMHMLAFYNIMRLSSDTLVYIGDNDSGKVIFGLRLLPLEQVTEQKVNTYSYFGITRIINQDYICFFKTPAYAQHQPTGHFHYDNLSIIFGIYKYNNYIPILIDPGTYSYTGNTTLRKLMRSRLAHNTISIEPLQSLQEQKDQLFFLPDKLSEQASIITSSIDNTVVFSSYDTQSFSKNGIELTRSISIQKQLQSHIVLTCRDSIIQHGQTDLSDSQYYAHQVFILHPLITLEKKHNRFIMYYKSTLIGYIETQAVSNTKTYIYASDYGINTQTQGIITSYPVTSDTIIHMPLVTICVY